MNAPCPRCGRETRFEDNPFRPFCSERCKLLDLGKWLDESYRTPGGEGEPDDRRPDPPDEGGDS